MSTAVVAVRWPFRRRRAGHGATPAATAAVHRAQRDLAEVRGRAEQVSDLSAAVADPEMLDRWSARMREAFRGVPGA